jgi:hypothetical protein
MISFLLFFLKMYYYNICCFLVYLNQKENILFNYYNNDSSLYMCIIYIYLFYQLNNLYLVSFYIYIYVFVVLI